MMSVTSSPCENLTNQMLMSVPVESRARKVESLNFCHQQCLLIPDSMVNMYAVVDGGIECTDST